MKIKIVDTYSGRNIVLNVKKEKFLESEGWNFLTNYQRKRIEKFFGYMIAYHCKIYTTEDIEYSYYGDDDLPF